MRETYSGMLFYPNNENEIFVFGSNTEGRHGRGAASTAAQHWGAKYGQASGLQGQSYAIITKDLTQTTHPSISKEFIKKQINDLYRFANQYSQLKFFIAYSGNGENLNGYTNNEMAEMFRNDNIPSNIIFEEEFNKLVFN